MPSYHAHIGYDLPARSRQWLQAALSEQIRLTIGEEVPPDVHALVSGRPTPEQLASSTDLNVLVIPFAGLPAITKTRLADFPQLRVHNLHHNAAATAELAVGLLFACARGIVQAHNSFRGGDWTSRYEADPMPVILSGKTALVLGYGEVGRRVGKICEAVGMRVIGVRKHASKSPDEITLAEMNDWLPQAHALIIALPNTPETVDLIGADELTLLPTEAIVVNIGRAAVIDEAALYHALKQNKLHAAAMDVWYIYPPDEEARTHTYPADHPFWELDNMVMSPHRGGAFGNKGIEKARMDGIARALNAAAAGGEIPSPVNVDEGY